MLEKKGDINGAIDFFDRACAAGHPTAQDRIVSLKKNLAKEGKAHYLSGLKYSKQGNFRQAEHWYLQSTAIDSEYAGKAWNDLGNLAFKSGDTGKALERYGRAISAGLAVACYNYAYTLEISSKNSLAALSFYREARKGGYTKAESRIAALELNLANIRDRERARQAENKYQEGLEAESLFDFPWAREAFETAASLGHTGANIKLLTLSQQPQHRSSMTHREAEFVMAEWCRWWGIKDARPGKGQKDKGVDIESKHIVGQVKHRASASTQEDLQKLHSNMNDFGKAGVFFSRSGFTKPAKDFANQSNIKIAIFEFNWHGVPKPLNEYAKHIVSRGHVFQN